MRKVVFIFPGPPNKNGLCVFGCEPCHGTLEPAESKEILISFSPDHCSDLFCDELEVNVNGIVGFIIIKIVYYNLSRICSYNIILLYHGIFVETIKINTLFLMRYIYVV